MKTFFQRKSQQVLDFWEKHQHRIGIGGLAMGFVSDLFLAKRPDSVVDNILLLTYLCLAGLIIVILNIRSKKLRAIEREHPAEPLFLLLMLQFCFGGLANNMLILYGKSGTLGGSALFILLLASLALGNEFLKSRYAQLRFNIAVYYVLLLTYAIIAVPTFVLHRIGTEVFLLSGLLSLVIIGVFLYILFLFVFRGDKKRQLYEASAIVLGIFCIFNGLYFLNIIPPVPLSLKQIGIYHSLAPFNDASGSAIYTATYEAPAWYVFWRDTSGTFAYQSGQSAYCFSAVFAPSDLATPVVHRWEEYNMQIKTWETRALVSFPIDGGRANGYRGFSIESALEPGQWRCDVETSSGQLIGRISFTVVQSDTPVMLSTTDL